MQNKKKTVVDEMAEAGLQFGQAVSKRHPKMDPYIESVKGSVHIINLQITEEKLKNCLDYLSVLKKEGKIIMFVSTKPEFRKIVKETAEECEMPYVIHRFLGGMMTNFKTIKKRIDYYNTILKQRESGELERKYTKQERVKISKELEGLEKNFEGVLKLERIPDAIFVVDMIKDKLAIKEAKMCDVKVIAIADTNTDPTQTDCFIPANDDSISSVSYILNKVKSVLK
jgi:small subunit ribosomal protein S2